VDQLRVTILECCVMYVCLLILLKDFVDHLFPLNVLYNEMCLLLLMTMFVASNLACEFVPI
jgi:hypothetical protein